MPNDLNPRDLLSRFLRLWWLAAALMLLGGLAGELVFRGRPALYESQALFTFSFDFARLGKLLERDEDQAMGAAGTILRNPTLIAQLQAALAAQGLVPPGYDLWEQTSAERKSYRWILRARHPDPQAAVKIADAWSQAGLAALAEAAAHAERANSQQQALAGLENCLRHMAVTEPASAQCAWPALPEAQKQVEAAGQAYLEERAASRGMISGFSFELSERPQAPGKPVTAGRGTQVLAGGLLGFALGMALIASGLPDALRARVRHAGQVD